MRLKDMPLNNVKVWLPLIHYQPQGQGLKVKIRPTYQPFVLDGGLSDVTAIRGPESRVWYDEDPTLSKPVSAEHRPKFCSPSQRMATSQYKRYFLKRDNQSTLHGLIIITFIRKSHRYTIIYKRKIPILLKHTNKGGNVHTHLKCNSLKISARHLPEDQNRYVGK